MQNDIKYRTEPTISTIINITYLIAMQLLWRAVEH